MNKTRQFEVTETTMMVNTKQLQAMLNCGEEAAKDIGREAGAMVKRGRRYFWNTNKIQKYLDQISE